jgi:hypothetical protein
MLTRLVDCTSPGAFLLPYLVANALWIPPRGRLTGYAISVLSRTLFASGEISEIRERRPHTVTLAKPYHEADLAKALETAMMSRSI